MDVAPRSPSSAFPWLFPAHRNPARVGTLGEGWPRALRLLRAALAVVIACQVGIVAAEAAADPSFGADGPLWPLVAIGLALVAGWQIHRRSTHSRASNDAGAVEEPSNANVHLVAALCLGAARRNRSDAQVLAVHLGVSAIEVFWDRPPPRPRRPWQQARTGWIWIAPAAPIGQPWDASPAEDAARLVGIGGTGLGELYVNMTALPTINVGGDRAAAQCCANHLARAMHAAGSDVWSIGNVSRVADLECRELDPDDALTEARRRRAYQSATTDLPSTPPLVVLIGEDMNADPRLDLLARALRSQSDANCLVLHTSLPDAVEIRCAAGMARLPFLGDVTVALSPGDNQSGDARDLAAGHELGGSPVLEPSAPAIGVDTDDGAVRVLLLGPVAIVGCCEPVIAKSAELVAFLACHPDGVSDERVQTALSPERVVAPKTWRNRMSKVRRALGTSASGEPRVSHLDNGIRRLSPDVVVDVHQLSAALEQARREEPPMAVATLEAGLRLVRGRPFDESEGYEWAFADLHVAHAEQLVVDAAHTLAELALTASELSRARWAVEHGARACPSSEVLAQDRMRIAHAAGDLSGVDAVMRDLRAALDGEDPARALHPETFALYEHLKGRKS
ncbi:MAG: bacterial transcriptional activator domain-containing protein [Chloroflexota bacterium]